MRGLTPVLLLLLPAGCGGSKQLRTLETQRYISSVPLGTGLSDVARDLGGPAAKAAYKIGPRRIELLFYRTSVRSSNIGVVYSSGYTPLFFEGGRLVAVGWESGKPEFSRQDTEKVMTQVPPRNSGGQMLNKDPEPNAQKQQAP